MIPRLIDVLPPTWLYRANHLYWKLAKPRTLGVKALLTNQHGHILLVHTSYETYWSLPGGSVEKHEHPEAAILRELHEETGLDAGQVTGVAVAAIYTNTAQGKLDTIILYRIEANADSVQPQAEVRQAGFFPPDHLPPTTSAATRRRIAEILHHQPRPHAW